MTLEEQWQEDVKQFEERAYLMWKISIFGRSDDDFVDSCDNNNAYKFIKTLYAKRKQSADLPFDLVAARAGDAVEMNIDEKWFDCKYCGVTKYHTVKVYCTEFGSSFEFANHDRLRMRHPRRIGVDYSQFED